MLSKCSGALLILVFFMDVIVYFMLVACPFWLVDPLLLKVIRQYHFANRRAALWIYNKHIEKKKMIPQPKETRHYFTYIIGHYNHSLRITTQLLTYTAHSFPLVLCMLIVCMSGGTSTGKVDSERHTFKKLFMTILFNLRFFARNLFGRSRRRNIFSYFRFDV